jgi:hypothetical protein
MRIPVLLICGGLAACTSNAVTYPQGNVITEVPQAGIASTAGGDNFTSTIESSLADGGTGTVPTGVAPSPDGTGPALDDDRINLMQWTLEQQKIDAAKAQRDLDAARNQLVIVQPGRVPSEQAGVNVALYAKQSNNAVGQSIYSRSAAARVASMGSCGRYRDPDAAQRAFLAAGGPTDDRLGLDPDGDGFACSFDPGVYRALN